MAEYSKEWCEVNQKQLPYDFSIREVFLELQEGESCETICEGFGVIKIMRSDRKCIVLFSDGRKISIEELSRTTS